MKNRTNCLQYKGFLFLAFFFPLLLTWVYFTMGAGAPGFQKATYFFGKIIQFSLPVIGIYVIQKKSPTRVTFPRGRYLLEGFFFGLVVSFLMIGAYLNLKDLEAFRPSFDQLNQDLGSRFSSLGLTSFPAFLLLGLFYSIIHSGLEEYYWRWFVFGELWKKSGSFLLAALLGSLGFTLHHILILGSFFGYNSWVAGLSITGVFIGGFYWSCLYRRANSLLAPWLSHGIIDAAIFITGYFVLFKGAA